MFYGISTTTSLVGFYGISTTASYSKPNPLHVYILINMIWFGWVLWDINNCRLYNVKFSLWSKVKLATVIEGAPKAPFSIASTPRYWRGLYSIPWIAPLYPWYLIMLNVKQGGIKYHFLSLCYDSTWNWTPVSQTIGEHSTHYANKHILLVHF